MYSDNRNQSFLLFQTEEDPWTLSETVFIELDRTDAAR